MGNTYRLGVIGGDGTGPEVIREALKVLDAAEERFAFSTERTDHDLGADAYERTGEALPDAVLADLRTEDAILLGAVGLRRRGDPIPPGVLERGLLLRLRFELDQYINLRPIKLYPGVSCPISGVAPEDVDMVVVRENTEGLYAGAGGFLKKGTPDEVALQTSVNTYKGVERCVRYAFELAGTRPRRKLTFCGKTNVLTFAHDLWSRVVEEVARDHPDVEHDYAHVDALCFWLIQNPESFDVIVTDNQLGDIVTDLGAAIQGGMGVAASGNINPSGVSMFEPIGGTAPDFTGKGVINPMAAVGACQMMLRHLGEADAADAVERAMMEVFPRMKGMGAEEMGYSTSEVGDMVADAIR